MALFTVETAAEMGRRSAQLRKERAMLPQPTEPAMPQTSLGIVEPTEQTPDFVTLRLSRVRAQLVRLDALAAQEDDPKRIREYADATSRLQEQERQLAGRPLPGTLKPSAKSTQPRRTVSPVGVEPTIPSVPADPTSTQ